mmetsp:Transcript_52723/g.115004  ORF Transcript_52723/g.115004 Transcript_52723/m.115004 type:complete len:327 (-) Transcript_52723:95-1075(-)
MLIYSLSRSEIYASLYAVIDAVNHHLNVPFPALDDIAALQEISDGFQEHSREKVWRGQVGAIDGVHIAMQNPGAAIADPKSYFVPRKDEFALLCIAICDQRRRFIYHDISSAPTTHDSMAWANSPLGQEVIAGKLPYGFFFNGDAAFSLSNSLLTPSGGDPALDAYDFEQSSNRMPIECAFGILVRRFGVFWRPLAVRFDRRAKLVGACMRLHNFCIDRNISHENVLEHGMSEIQPNRYQPAPVLDHLGRPTRALDTRGLPRPPWPRPTSQSHTLMRNSLAKAVTDAGLVRPPLREGLVPKPAQKRGRSTYSGLECSWRCATALTA